MKILSSKPLREKVIKWDLDQEFKPVVLLIVEIDVRKKLYYSFLGVHILWVLHSEMYNPRHFWNIFLGLRIWQIGDSGNKPKYPKPKRSSYSFKYNSIFYLNIHTFFKLLRNSFFSNFFRSHCFNIV